MRIMLCTALLVVATTVPARAADESTYSGGCSFRTARVPGTPEDTYTGTMTMTVTLSSPDPADTPVSATVTCYTWVNGVALVDPLTASGTGVVATGRPVQFTQRPGDIATGCIVVDYTSDATPTDSTCP